MIDIILKINKKLYEKKLINYETYIKKEKEILNEFS